MDKTYKNLLRDNRMLLLENLDYNELRDYLIQRRVITADQDEYIMTGKTSKDRTRNLIDKLPGLGPKAFDKFCVILDECDADYDHILDALKYQKKNEPTSATTPTSQTYQPQSSAAPVPQQASQTQVPYQEQASYHSQQGNYQQLHGQYQPSYQPNQGFYPHHQGQHYHPYQGPYPQQQGPYLSGQYASPFMSYPTGPYNHPTGYFHQPLGVNPNVSSNLQDASAQRMAHSQSANSLDSGKFSSGNSSKDIQQPVTTMSHTQAQTPQNPGTKVVQSNSEPELMIVSDSGGGDTVPKTHTMQFQSMGGSGAQEVHAANEPVRSAALASRSGQGEPTSGTDDVDARSDRRNQPGNLPTASATGEGIPGNLQGTHASLVPHSADVMPSMDVVTTRVEHMSLNRASTPRPCTFINELCPNDLLLVAEEILLGDLANYIVNLDHLGACLGIESYKVDQIKRDNPSNVIEQSLRLLITWKQKNSTKATLKCLIKALHKANVDEGRYREAINEYLKDLADRETNNNPSS